MANPDNITLRSEKGSFLTFEEMDLNMTELQNQIIEYNEFLTTQFNPLDQDHDDLRLEWSNYQVTINDQINVLDVSISDLQDEQTVQNNRLDQNELDITENSSEIAIIETNLANRVVVGEVGDESINTYTGEQTVTQSIDRRGIVFETVADMQAFAGLQVGAKVRTLGYYSPGDGGGNDYEIVAAGTGVDDGGSFIDLSGSGLQAKALFGATVNVKQFGAKGDNVNNETAAINSCISYVSASGGGSVFLPRGNYRVHSINVLKDTSIIGERQENGWMRRSSYAVSSCIRSLDNSNISPVVIGSGASNWGIQDLIIDANKDNQTSKGIHCIAYLVDDTRGGSQGGLIDGVKCVNPNGFGLYAMALRPTDISNSFFMNGMFLSYCADVLISNCSIDGTSNDKPNLWLADSAALTVDSCFVFRSESPSNDFLVSVSSVNVTDNTLTLTDDSGIYDGMPIRLVTSGDYPGLTYSGEESYGQQTYIAKKIGNNKIELYRLTLKLADRVDINSAGTGSLSVSGGSQFIASLSRCNRVRIANSRIAGSPGGATEVVLSLSCTYAGNTHYALNANNLTDVKALSISASSQNIFSHSQLGDLFPVSDTNSRILTTVFIEDLVRTDGTLAVSSANLLVNNMYNNTQGEYVKDTSSSSYFERNMITGTESLFGNSARFDSLNFKSEPGRLYFYGKPQALTISPTTETGVTWDQETPIGNPAGIAGGVRPLVFPNTANSLIDVSGSVGFSSVPDESFYVLVYINVTDGGSTIKNRFYYKHGVGDNSAVIVPINVKIPVGNDAKIDINIFHNASTALTLNTDKTYSKLSVLKVADTTL